MLSRPGTPRLSVVTWRWARPDGTHLFGPEYVNRLFAGVTRHLHVPFDFFCITNDADGLDPGIRVVPLPTQFADTLRCRRRLWQFDRAREEIFGPRMLCLDLDLVIVNDITPLVRRREALVCWRVRYANCYSGAVLLLKTGALHGLYAAFHQDPEGYPERTGQKRASDLAMLNFYLKTQPPPASWDESDGIVTYFGDGYRKFEHFGVGPNRPQLPPNARIVVLGSADKQVMDEGRFDWIRQHWFTAQERQPRVVPMMPYALDRNLGRAYNEAMELLEDDDWAVFLDHDAMHTTRDWYRLIVDAIRFKPDAGAFVAVTNRIDAFWQRAPETDRDNHDIGYHTAIGLERLKRRTLLDITETKGFGGVCFAVSKAGWRAAGGFADGLLCVDHSLHFGLQRAGRRIYLLEGLYCYHRRRAFVGPLPDDTPRAANCPCRGTEQTPKVRINLPEPTA